MDSWHRRGTIVTGNTSPVVAVSTHFDCAVCPETRSAFPWFERAILEDLPKEYTVVGHCHPRAKLVPAKFRAAGIDFYDDFDDILRIADIYVCDQSSTLYEFASTGRPVLCYNAPIYRRHVNHGLRFWDSPPGLQCDNQDDLLQSVMLALADPPSLKEIRARGLAEAYLACDGYAAARAAAAILHWRENL